MIRKALLSFGLALGLVTSAPASAAVLGTFDIVYGGGAGITFSEADEESVFGTFDFSSLAGQQIDSLSVSVTFADTGPTTFFGFPAEIWRLDIAPGVGNVFATTANVLTSSGGGFSTLTNTITAAADVVNGSAFADAVASLSLGFGFVDTGFFFNNFTLVSASLTVEGTNTAVVPLPAPVWLLLTALGGLGIASRRQKRRLQAA